MDPTRIDMDLIRIDMDLTRIDMDPTRDTDKTRVKVTGTRTLAKDTPHKDTGRATVNMDKIMGKGTIILDPQDLTDIKGIQHGVENYILKLVYT